MLDDRLNEKETKIVGDMRRNFVQQKKFCWI